MENYNYFISVFFFERKTQKIEEFFR
nr:hypothetical protein [Peptoniphilus indolicus]